MVLIELVYCKITGKTRSLPRIHHFVPLEPWSCRKIKAKRKYKGKWENKDKTDGPSPKIVDRDKKIKVVLDMSNDGPTFKMLEDLMGAISGKDGDKAKYEALRKLLQSGIPGMEEILSKDGKGFIKMSDEAKARFLSAVTGSDGKVSGLAAAALIAAAASGGDPDIANKIVEKMMGGIGTEIDPAMMAALMATTAMVAQGASNEEILKAMQKELENSGLSSEEILAKTMLLQKALAGDNSPAFVNKTLKNALEAADIVPEEFRKALLIEKVLGATGATAENIAKCLLLQSVLAEKGLNHEVIAKALSGFLDEEEIIRLALEVKDKYRRESMDVRSDDVHKGIALASALESEKIRGFKDLLKILDECRSDVIGAEDVAEKLKEAIAKGLISSDDLTNTVVLQKTMSAIKIDPKMLSKTIKLQKAVLDHGMPSYELENALSLLHNIDLDSAKYKKDLDNAMAKVSSQGLNAEDVQLLLKLKDSFKNVEDIPEEVLRLLKKAMKQRRGSVDNIAESLMATLAASGENQENIVKAMVKALKASGGRDDEIVRIMLPAMMGKEGLSKEEVARQLIAALAESGASGKDMTGAMKQLFSACLDDQPESAAEIAQTIAECLAFSGACAEDVADAIKAMLDVSLGKTEDSSGKPLLPADEMMDIFSTMSRLMAETGVSPEFIGDVLKEALDAKCLSDPDLVQDLTKAMTKAMAKNGASFDDISNVVKKCFEKSVLSDEEKALLTLQIVASSGANPSGLAKFLVEFGSEAGLSEEEMESKAIDAMVESGASVREVAKAVAKYKMLKNLANPPAKMADQILKEMRQGNELSMEKLKEILKAGGLDEETTGKCLLIQKALGIMKVDPEDLSRNFFLEKAMLDGGISAQQVSELLNDLVKSLKGNLGDEMQSLISALETSEIDYENILSAIQFDRNAAEEIGKIELDPTTLNKLKKFGGKAMEEILVQSNITPQSLLQSLILQKMMTSLGVSPDDIAKLFSTQRYMCELGATPQDIALLFQAFESTDCEFDRAGILDTLRNKLAFDLEADDIFQVANLLDAFKPQEISPDYITDLAFLERQISANINPLDFAVSKLARALTDDDDLENEREIKLSVIQFMDDMDLTITDLTKVILTQRAELGMGLKCHEMEAFSLIEEAFDKSGKPPESIANAYKLLLRENKGEIKTNINAVISSIEKKNLGKKDILMSKSLLQNIKNNPEKVESLSKKFATAKTPQDMLKVVKDTLNKENIESKALVKQLLKRKVQAMSEVKPEKVVKVLTMQKLLLDKSVPADKIARAISLVADPFSTESTMSMKEMLLSLMESDDMKIDSNLISFKRSINENVKNLVRGEKSVEQVQNALELGFNAVNMTPADAAKAMLVQKALKEIGVSPDVMSKLMLLQKSFLDAGYTTDEISKILEEAAKGGMDESTIETLLERIGDSGQFSAEDIANLASLQQCLKKGTLPGPEITPELLNQALMIDKVLKEACGDDDVLKAAMEDLISKGDSASIKDVVSKVLKSKGIEAETFKKAKLLKNTLEKNSLVGVSLNVETLNGLNQIEKALTESGIDETKIKNLMQKVANGSLDETDLSTIQSALKKVLKKAPEKTEDINKLIQDLKSGNLQMTGMSPKVINAITTLNQALKSCLNDEEKVNSLISKALSGDLTKDELNAVRNQILDSQEISQAEKDKINEIFNDIVSGNLRASNIDSESLKEVMKLQDILKKSGMDSEGIELVLSRATSSGLKENEIKNLMDKVMKSPNLTTEDKRQMESLQNKLINGQLRTSAVQSDAMKSVVKLGEALKASNFSNSEVTDILGKISRKEMSGEEIDSLFDKILSNNLLSDEQKTELEALKSDMKNGKLHNPFMNDEALSLIMSLKDTLVAGGCDEEEMVHLLCKAANQGLNEKEVKMIVANAMEKNNFSPEEKKNLKALQNKLIEGKSKIGVSSDMVQDALAVNDFISNCVVNKEDKVKLLEKVMDGKTKKSDIDIMVNKVINQDFASSEDDQALTKGMLSLLNMINDSDIDPALAQDLLGKAFGTGLKKEEILDVIQKISQNKNLSKEEKDFIKKFQATLNESNNDVVKVGNSELMKVLTNDASTSEDIKSVLGSLREAMEEEDTPAKSLISLMSILVETDLPDDDLKSLLVKASNGSLSKEDIASVIQKAQNSLTLSKEKKDQLEKLKDTLDEFDTLKLTSSDLTEMIMGESFDRRRLLKALDTCKDALDKNDTSEKAVISLITHLTGTDMSQKEIEDLISKASGPGLSKEEVLSLINKSKASKTMTEKQKAELDALEIAVLNQKSESFKVTSSEFAELASREKPLSKKDMQKALEGVKNKIDQSESNAKTVLSLLDIVSKTDLGEEEMKEILTKAMQSGLTKKEMNNLIQKLKSSSSKLTPEDQGRLLELEKVVQSSKQDKFEVGSDLMKNVFLKESVSKEAKRKILESMKEILPQDISEEQKSVLNLLSMLNDTDISDEEMKKLVAKVNGPGLDKNDLEKIVQKIKNNPNLSKEDKEQALKIQKTLEKNSRDIFKVNAAVLKNVSSDENITKEDIKNILKKVSEAIPNSAELKVAEKALLGGSLSGFSLNSSNIEKIATLERILEASGQYTNDEISKIISDATSGGMSEGALNQIRNNLLQSNTLDKEDLKAFDNLESSVLAGELQISGVNPQILHGLSLISKSLSDQGEDWTSICDMLANALDTGLTENKLNHIHNLIKNNPSLSEAEKAEALDLLEKIHSGEVSFKGMSGKALDDALQLKRILEGSGMSSTEADKLIAKATGCGLHEDEIKSIVSKVMSSGNLTPEDCSRFAEIEKKLRTGQLRTKGIKANDAGAIMTISDILRTADFNSKEISSLLSELANGTMDSSDLDFLIVRLEEAGVSSDDIKTLQKAFDQLRIGNLNAAGATPEQIENILSLKKALDASNVSQKKIAEILCKAANRGLSKQEIQDVIENALKNKDLSFEERAVISALRSKLESNELKVGHLSPEQLRDIISIDKVMQSSNLDEGEKEDLLRKVASGAPVSIGDVHELLASSACDKPFVSQSDIECILTMEKNLQEGKLAMSGMKSETVDKLNLLKKLLEDEGRSNDEIMNLLVKATTTGLSNECISNLMSNALNKENLSPKEREAIMDLQSRLKDGSLKLGAQPSDCLARLMKSGELTPESIAQALLAQKIMAGQGMSPEDMAKAAMIQKFLKESGASDEVIAEALKRSVQDSGASFESVLKEIAKDVKEKGLKLDPENISKIIQLQKALGASSAAKLALSKMNPDLLNLIDEIATNRNPGDVKSMIRALKDTLGEALDDSTIGALEIAACMEKAGADQDEIEEMMAMVMNKEGGVSQEFLNNLKKIVEDNNQDPEETLKRLRDAVEEEMKSLGNNLRNTFLNKIPTQEDLDKTCQTLAEKLNANSSSKNDVKLALMDILDEALQDVSDYEPDADILFNYLMASALAEATDTIDKKGMRPSGDELQDLARRGMLDMIRRLLMEADLNDELKKLDVFGRSMNGIREFLSFLLSDEKFSSELRKQVAFLYDFDEIEHTTVLSLTLRDIIRDARQKLKPWELSKLRKLVKGYRKSKMPKLAYSQVFCFYKILPDHIDGPPIGLDYEEG